MTTALEGFAGPGGFSEAVHMLGLGETLGIEVNADACVTATAAGHPRLQADIRSIDPYDCTGVTGWISGSPCPTYADSGKRTGRDDFAIVLDGATVLGDTVNTVSRSPADDAYAAAYEQVQDERSAFVLEALKFALRLPDLDWLVAEQVPAVEKIWWEFAAELAYRDWESAAVLVLRADDFGAPTRRTRVFLLAARNRALDIDGLPTRGVWGTGRFEEPWTAPAFPFTPFPRLSMANALGWPSGVRINTRGDRKTSGGNEFPADLPAIALTGRARSWFRADLGKPDGYLEPWQAGLLQGFPHDYPWRGSRTSQFQQAADSVPPLMGAAVLGVAAGVPWQPAVWGRLNDLYGAEPGDPDVLRICDTTRIPGGQLDLFGEAA